MRLKTTLQLLVLKTVQYVNKISRSTQWKDRGKNTKRKGSQTDFSKFQKHTSTETSMECKSKAFIIKL